MLLNSIDDTDDMNMHGDDDDDDVFVENEDEVDNNQRWWLHCRWCTSRNFCCRCWLLNKQFYETKFECIVSQDYNINMFA